MYQEPVVGAGEGLERSLCLVYNVLQLAVAKGHHDIDAALQFSVPPLEKKSRHSLTV
jgi:hypothetical protein